MHPQVFLALCLRQSALLPLALATPDGASQEELRRAQPHPPPVPSPHLQLQPLCVLEGPFTSMRALKPPSESFLLPQLEAKPLPPQAAAQVCRALSPRAPAPGPRTRQLHREGG